MPSPAGGRSHTWWWTAAPVGTLYAQRQIAKLEECGRATSYNDWARGRAYAWPCIAADMGSLNARADHTLRGGPKDFSAGMD